MAERGCLELTLGPLVGICSEDIGELLRGCLCLCFYCLLWFYYFLIFFVVVCGPWFGLVCAACSSVFILILILYVLQGISATALKKACRELGVERWPYHRNRKAGSVSAEEKSRANTVSPPSPAEPMDFMDLLHRNAVMVLEAAKKLDAQKLDFPDAPVV